MPDFKIGQMVDYKKQNPHAPRGPSQIIQKMPREDSSDCNYRIRGPHESRERVASESELRPL